MTSLWASGDRGMVKNKSHKCGVHHPNPHSECTITTASRSQAFNKQRPCQIKHVEIYTSGVCLFIHNTVPIKARVGKSRIPLTWGLCSLMSKGEFERMWRGGVHVKSLLFRYWLFVDVKCVGWFRAEKLWRWWWIFAGWLVMRDVMEAETWSSGGVRGGAPNLIDGRDLPGDGLPHYVHNIICQKTGCW